MLNICLWKLGNNYYVCAKFLEELLMAAVYRAQQLMVSPQPTYCMEIPPKGITQQVAPSKHYMDQSHFHISAIVMNEIRMNRNPLRFAQWTRIHLDASYRPWTSLSSITWMQWKMGSYCWYCACTMGWSWCVLHKYAVTSYVACYSEWHHYNMKCS